MEAIVEAGTYILREHGPGGFTANKVAEKAGVNIASFYQYYPNKEALLFHITNLTWGRQLARLTPILEEEGPDHARKLRDFIREFFLIEAAEVDIRRALRIASVELRETAEFNALILEGYELTKRFIARAVAPHKTHDLDFNVDFIVMLVTSFAERTTDGKPSTARLIRQADLLTDMLIAQFQISS
ncbi:TetR/AcrR family transcriptional regulator [Pseudorhizobium pelagicum]|uniref:TetR/AcrR family transcriptional regulator n=1 Tax=Pseudorhizobium pelagicum TaxID=1509405 RepID=UPI00192C26E0|nr:TetR/AcrR family transcriptional regulator [Pseudorhizobium pelagicum]